MAAPVIPSATRRFTVRRSTSVLLAGSVLGALGVIVFSSLPSIAEFTGGGGNVPVDILSAPRLDVSATTPPGTTLSVSGVDGTVLRTDLASASLNALLHPECTQGLPEIVEVGITAQQLPRGPGHADPATSWRVVNLSNNRRLCCMPSFDGGVPTIGCDPPADGGVNLGYVVAPGYGTLEITGENFTHMIYCRADGTMPSHVVNVNNWEDSCVQP